MSPTQFRQTLVTPKVETAIILPASVERVIVENISAGDVRLAWITGKVVDDDADWDELQPGDIYDSGELVHSAAPTLYATNVTVAGAKLFLSLT